MSSSLSVRDARTAYLRAASGAAAAWDHYIDARGYADDGVEAELALENVRISDLKTQAAYAIYQQVKK